MYRRRHVEKLWTQFVSLESIRVEMVNTDLPRGGFTECNFHEQAVAAELHVEIQLLSRSTAPHAHRADSAVVSDATRLKYKMRSAAAADDERCDDAWVNGALTDRSSPHLSSTEQRWLTVSRPACSVHVCMYATACLMDAKWTEAQRQRRSILDISALSEVVQEVNLKASYPYSIG